MRNHFNLAASLSLLTLLSGCGDWTCNDSVPTDFKPQVLKAADGREYYVERYGCGFRLGRIER